MWLLCAGLKQMCSVLQVVCFEGNAGFYEMGCSGTPIECGYSVLGWNHPGFAGSTVSPAGICHVVIVKHAPGAKASSAQVELK